MVSNSSQCKRNEKLSKIFSHTRGAETWQAHRVIFLAIISLLYLVAKFSKATTSFVFRRRRQYFVFRIYIPSILIVMVSWSTFWISQAAVPARAGICITTILTLITMLGVVNNNMPKVSYIKAIDLYLLVSFIFVFASLVEYIIVLNFSDCYIRKKKKEKGNADRDESDPSQNNVCMSFCSRKTFISVVESLHSPRGVKAVIERGH